MNAYAITAFHRPHDLPNLLENFRRQIFQNKYLIIIKNGKDVADLQPILQQNELLLTSDIGHQSNAKNVAIDWIGHNDPIGAVITMDADDYYAPSYMPEIVWQLGNYPHDIVGKHTHLVSTDTLGTILYTHPVPWYLHGATLSWMYSDNIRFKFFDKKFGEDFDLVRRFPGEKITTSPWNYRYIRKHYGRDHTWDGTDYQIKNSNTCPQQIQDVILKQMTVFNCGISF